MLFNSQSFFWFFPIVTSGYFFLPHRFRWAWLLGASCVFYMAFVPAYILILFATVTVDYFAGILIESAPARRRKACLIVSLASNIGFLAYFKYCNFFIENAAAAARFLGWDYSLPALNIVLPIGLSFHTFQAMSYTIEVFRGRQKAERHFGIFALYVMFYPQLVAGPIERPQNLLPQFRERHVWDWDRASSGLQLMLWGLFKKTVIADRVAVLVDAVYALPPHSQPGSVWALALFFFSIQIYCDFSGYSDIAIGAARVMGFRLMNNFNSPYFSASVPEFWRRWHISLSSWFRDYVYIPLGGSRMGRARWARNILIVFGLSGLWHGPQWTFVAWGFLHGGLMILSRWTAAFRARMGALLGLERVPALHQIVRAGLTFLWVSAAFAFFRARSARRAADLLADAARGWENIASPRFWADSFSQKTVGLSHGQIGIAFAAILSMAAVEWLRDRPAMARKFFEKPEWVRWPAYYVLILSIVLLGYFENRRFIYFQF